MRFRATGASLLLVVCATQALCQTNESLTSVVMLTDKADLLPEWKSLLGTTNVKEFEALVKKLPQLMFLQDGNVGYLFDQKALGIDDQARFGEIMQELSSQLASGKRLQKTKLSELPPALQASLRQRFSFHKSIELEGLESLDFGVSLATGLNLTFEKDGKKVRLNHTFPYQKPDGSATVKKRARPLAEPTNSPGALTRTILPGHLVAHFSNPLLVSDVLMSHSSNAFEAAAKHVRAVTASTSAAIEDFWRKAIESQDDVDPNVQGAKNLQDLPEAVRDALLSDISAGYANYGFASAQEAADFLRFARVSHLDRKLSFSVAYSVEGQAGSTELLLSTVLDHR
jgi:hypothetical protein